MNKQGSARDLIVTAIIFFSVVVGLLVISYVGSTIVDNVVRAIPNIQKWITKLKDKKRDALEEIVNAWDNKKMLKDVYSFISKRLNSLS